MKQLFAFDIDKYKNQLAEIDKLDSTYTAILMDDNESKYGGVSNKIDKYKTIEEEMIQKSEKLIEMFPDNFKYKLWPGYCNALDFSFITITEGETENENTDFGITWR